MKDKKKEETQVSRKGLDPPVKITEITAGHCAPAPASSHWLGPALTKLGTSQASGTGCLSKLVKDALKPVFTLLQGHGAAVLPRM